MQKTPIGDAAIFRADYLFKKFWFCDARATGIGPGAIASFEAGAHIRKTIEALIVAGADEAHLDFYYQMHARLVSYDNTNYIKGQLADVFCKSMHGIA